MKQREAFKIRRFKRQSGFSLVELMVVIFIFVFILSGLMMMAVSGERIWRVNHARILLQQELRKAVEWMINDLRQAGAGSILDVPADDDWYSQITFKVPSGVTSGIPVWGTDTIQFVRGGADSTQLQRVEGENSKVLAQYISSLGFRRPSANPNVLDVALTAQKDQGMDVPMTHQLNFSVELRN